MSNIIDSIQLSGTVYALSAQTSGSDTYVSGITVDSGAPIPSVVADGYVKLTWDDDYTQTYTVDYSGSIGDGDTHDSSNVTKIEFGSSSTAINLNFGFDSDSCYHLKTAIFNGDINFEHDFYSAYQLEAVYFFAPNPSGITGNSIDESFLNYVYDGCETYESTEATYSVYVADLAAYSGATLYYDENEQTNVTWGQHFGNRLQQIPSKSLVLTYNDPQKAPISVPISAITEGTGGGNPTVELTQAEYDALVSAGTVSADTYYIITDAQAGDLTNYYTKTETNSAITQAVSVKQDTLVSGTNIKTINNESLLGSGNIDIQGGGKAVSGGTNISITTGETADTINCTLPFSYEGDNLKTTVSGNSFVNYFHYGQIFGINNKLQGKNGATGTIEKNTTIVGYNNQSLRMDNSIVIGSSNNLGNIFCVNNNNYVFGFSNTVNPVNTQDNIANNNFVIGNNNTINQKSNNFIFGYGIKPSNNDEFSLGKYNNSVSGSSTFGDSGNTLFSVGNGTAENARHNAFEIRQNGDIYYFDGTNDVKLQDKFSSIDTTIGDINTILQSI